MIFSSTNEVMTWWETVRNTCLIPTSVAVRLLALHCVRLNCFSDDGIFYVLSGFTEKWICWILYACTMSGIDSNNIVVGRWNRCQDSQGPNTLAKKIRKPLWFSAQLPHNESEIAFHFCLCSLRNRGGLYSLYLRRISSTHDSPQKGNI